MEIETTGSRIVYGNRWMRVREDQIERANGSPGLYSVVEKLDYSLIIPRDDEGVFLVEQYRYPVRGRYLEFPQGTWEERPEAEPLEVAREELEAETGLRAESLLSLARLYWPTPRSEPIRAGQRLEMAPFSCSTLAGRKSIETEKLEELLLS
jgi:ADP-ribose pyrophosphatase